MFDMNIEINQPIRERPRAVQYDTKSRYLNVILLDSGMPFNLTDHSVKIFAKKPDGLEIWNSCEIIDQVNGNFVCELTDQILAVAGCVKACFVVYGFGGIEVLKTFDFEITVISSIYSTNAIESTSQFSALDTALNDVRAFQALIQNISDRMGWPHAEDVPNITLFDWLRNSDMSNIDATISSRASQDSVDELAKMINAIGKGFTLTSSGLWIKPAGTRLVRIICVAAGGGGGMGGMLGGSSVGGEGGYAGGIHEAVVDVSGVDSVMVTIGAGGLGAVGSNRATNGGNTSFGAFVSAIGGRGGFLASDTRTVWGGAIYSVNGGSSSSLSSWASFNGAAPGANGTGEVMIAYPPTGGSGGYGSIKLAGYGQGWSDGLNVITGGEGGSGYGAGGGGSVGGQQGGVGANGVCIIQCIGTSRP